MADASISIIIPAYNVDKYLKAALDTIKEQTTAPEEVILIDDGSTDSTLKLAKSYKLSVPYKVVSIENAGQGNARNLGVSLASSEYVYFFDSDDLLKNDFIQSMKKCILDNNNPDIVLFSGDSFDDNEYQGNRWVSYSRGFSGVFINRVELLDKGLKHDGLFCSPCLYVSRRTLWGDGGLEFGLNYFEDEAIFFNVLFACNNYLVIDEVFFLRRNRKNSTMTMKPTMSHVNGTINCIDITLELYNLKELTIKERWHVRARLEKHCIKYITMCRSAGVKPSYKCIVDVIKTTKNPFFTVTVLLYLSGLDSLNIVRKAGRMMRKLKNRLL